MPKTELLMVRNDDKRSVVWWGKDTVPLYDVTQHVPKSFSRCEFVDADCERVVYD